MLESSASFYTGPCGSDLEISVLVCGKGVKSVDQKGRGLIVSRYRREYSIPASCQRLTFLTKSNRQGLLLKTRCFAHCLRKKSLNKMIKFTEHIQHYEQHHNLWNAETCFCYLSYSNLVELTTNDCCRWDCSYLLAKQGVLHWWLKLLDIAGQLRAILGRFISVAAALCTASLASLCIKTLTDR